MSESSNDPVSVAFDELTEALKSAAFDPNGNADSLSRALDYYRIVLPVIANWKAGRPPVGKRGRKPKDRSAVAGGGAGDVSPDEESSELSATQTESDPPILGRAPRRFNA